ncbi:MAG: hypothetical protein HFF34_08000 [Oscillospiraceae bacterium]|nr:hypothetical protein [Oscillospiraceae bacterium]
MIYEMAASGVSLARISAYLEDMDIPSPKGKKTWSKETLRKILNNGCGKITLSQQSLDTSGVALI